MKYVSTRGGEEGLSFEHVLFAGYASDKGLYMPESIPSVSCEERGSWRLLPYSEILYQVLRKFIDQNEVPNAELKGVVERSMAKFSGPDVIPVTSLDCGLKVFELFHGRTLAFKDLAMSIVAEFLNYFLNKRKRHVTALVGTSGDTGGSAIENMKGLGTIDIIVLYPKYQVNRIQELQMATIDELNVHVYAVEGTSDDLDIPIKECFQDPKFASRHNLISVNSINWVRVCAQIAHYVYAYFKLSSDSSTVEIIVPSGAAGNITGGCIANKMGFPVQLVAAVNENDIVARAIHNGDFSVRDEVADSLASAMNIQVPYNIERILFAFSESKSLPVRQIMEEFEAKGKVQIPTSLLKNIKRVIVGTHVASNKDITSTTRKAYEKYKYVFCPHTAVGASYHFNDPRRPRGLIATASPAKFPEATLLAGAPPVTAGIEHLTESEDRSRPMKKGEDWLSILKVCIEEITVRRSISQ